MQSVLMGRGMYSIIVRNISMQTEPTTTEGLPNGVMMVVGVGFIIL